jgi:hypothetical protein
MKKPLQTQPRSWQWGTDVLAAADSGSVPVLETVFIDAASRAPSLWVYSDEGPTTRRRPASELNFFKVRERFTQFAAERRERAAGATAESSVAVAWTAAGARRVLDDAAFGRLLTDLARGSEPAVVALQPYISGKPRGGVYRVVSKDGGMGGAPTTSLVVRGTAGSSDVDARLGHELELFGSRAMAALQQALEEDAGGSRSTVATLEIEFSHDEVSDQLLLSNMRKIECLVPPTPLDAAAAADAQPSSAATSLFPVAAGDAVLSDSEDEDEDEGEGSMGKSETKQAQPMVPRASRRATKAADAPPGGRLPSLSGAAATDEGDFATRDRALGEGPSGSWSEEPSSLAGTESPQVGKIRPKRNQQTKRKSRRASKEGERGSS